MVRLRRRVVTVTRAVGGSDGARRCARRWSLAGRSLPGGAVLAGLVVLGGSVPASAQPLTWSVVPSPNQGTSRNFLQGVSCASATSCTAVGAYDNGSRVERTLIESWDGTGWSLVPSPNRGTSSNFLYSVSCASATSCVAAGSYRNVSRNLGATLIESWDGTRWSLVPSPNRSTSASGNNVLNGVSCVSATSCMAAGYYFPSTGGTKTLIESWNGTRWSLVPSLNPGPEIDVLASVSCVSATSCTATGTYVPSGGSGSARTLIESWDGTGWSVVHSRNPGGEDVLDSVSCVSTTSCVAAGSYTGGGITRTLIESWNGTGWSVVPSPEAGAARYNDLFGVSCVSAATCTAVGYYNDIRQSGAGTTTLIESWDGTQWSLVASPSPGVLEGVSCASAAMCTAAGSHHSGGTSKTLIESGTSSG